MSEPAYRKALDDVLGRDSIAHAGLMLDRCMTVPEGSKDVEKKETARHELVQAARRALSQCAELYATAFNRRTELLTTGSRSAVKFWLTTPRSQRIIVGLGRESARDTGLALHHTYGVPVIPGSALKGVAEHYCREVLKREGHDILFGTPGGAGYFAFHDAWIDPDDLRKSDDVLLADVMTPHHPKYYAKATYERSDLRIPPTDFDDPIPVPFLSVRGTFQLIVTCDDPSEHASKWLDSAKELLIAAIGNWGVGGKISSGYGRLVPRP